MTFAEVSATNTLTLLASNSDMKLAVLLAKAGPWPLNNRAEMS